MPFHACLHNNALTSEIKCNTEALSIAAMERLFSLNVLVLSPRTIRETPLHKVQRLL